MTKTATRKTATRARTTKDSPKLDHDRERRSAPCQFSRRCALFQQPPSRAETIYVNDSFAVFSAPPAGGPASVAADVTLRAVRSIEGTTTDKLVRRARAGDEEAYGMLFERFHDEIYRFAARRLGDPVAAQDAAAETFTDAFAGIGRFRFTGAPFEAWLYAIARRRVIDAIRSATRQVPVASVSQPRVEDHADGIAQTAHVRELIAGLPPTERMVVELRYMEDLDVDATARRLGKSPGAVRVAQHRALARLRAQAKVGRDGAA